MSGKGTGRGETRTELWGPVGLQLAPYLLATGPEYIADVFANSSFRQKKLTLETEIVAEQPQKITLKAEILDPNGKIVKSLNLPVSLKQGINTVKPEIPWKNPVCWELGGPYLYTCRVRVEKDGKVRDAYPPFTFGFREIWRDGKELFMNGHPLHIRPCYAFTANRYGAQFLQDIGYNAVTWNHDTNAYPSLAIRPERLQDYDEIGIGAFLSCGNANNIADGTEKLLTDPKTQEEYRRYIKAFHRDFRNHPSILACYVTQMIICEIDNFRPEKIAQVPGVSNNDRFINKAREINREYNPNVLYYSHADGSNGDLSSGNLYLNWTPLQEREEWLSQWAEKGKYPWHGAEFGQPYDACYWLKKNFIATEHFARHFGDEAYSREPLRGLEGTLEMSVRNIGSHGCRVPGFSLAGDYPLYWEVQRRWTWRTNRAWRAFGLNGGNIYFNLGEAYGLPPYRGTYNRYGALKQKINGKPEWANPGYDIYQLGNKDFCGFIGGTPVHTDKTHAYYAGKKIEKQAVFIWDGAKKKTFTVNWKAVCGGRSAGSGQIRKAMKTGDVLFEPFSFQTPKVSKKTNGEIVAEFSSDGKPVFTDRFPFEVYPVSAPEIKPRGEVALLDPTGKSAEIQKTFGIPFRTVKTTGELGNARYLILGKNALKNADFDFSLAEIDRGLRVLILPQMPDNWQALGFKVMDTMSRTVHLRDRKNPAFRELTGDVLHDWQGAPDYGKPFGPVMSHSAQRGPRWTRNHTVAGLMLQIPERGGFLPLIDGEFDMNYAALLRLNRGKGNITFCTLDFEDRTGKDPAATLTASAVLRDFLLSPGTNANRTIFADGAESSGLTERLLFTTVPQPSNAGIILAGGDAEHKFGDLREMAQSGKTILIFNNSRLAKEAGFGIREKELCRASVPESAAFAGTGPSQFRWRDYLKADLLENPPAGFRISADGLVAESSIGKGRIIFCQIAPFQLRDRYRDGKKIEAEAKNMEAQEKEFFTDLLNALGAGTRSVVKGDWWDSEAEKLLAKLKLPAKQANKWIRVAGNPQHTWKRIEDWARKGDTIFIPGNPILAEKAGFKLKLKHFSRIRLPEHELFAGIKRKELRYPLEHSVYTLSNAPECFEILADGVLAVGKIGTGTVVFFQLEPFRTEAIAKTFADRKKAIAASTERTLQLYARLLTNLDAEPSQDLAGRMLYQAGISAFSPLPAVHVLGPFALGKDDGKLMMNTVFPGEDFAIRGDFNPNPRFDLPQGGQTDWRPMLAPDASGKFDLAGLFPDAAFPVSYAICRIEHLRIRARR